MSRPPASIVILAWNSWETTRACLDSLRPTLGVHDQVVVVDNGSTDRTPQALAQYPWVEVVTNRENRGFAGGCNDGAARARHGILVFLNNDTVLPPHWIEPLVAAFDDPTVGAAGPRSNFVSGPQVVAEASYDSVAAMRRFARNWAAEHRGRMTDATRLVGFCLAVRREAFEAVGRFDEGYGVGGFEDDDLSARLIAAGRRMVIVHDSFVHHEGHKTFSANGLDWLAEQEKNRQRFFSAGASRARQALRSRPLVSACLITKDEEDRISECLSSLSGLADEVVVYDTGSSDATIEKARAAGATVVEGYWDDDFGRARNSALEQCRGDWVAWLDADETFEGDAGAVRSLLERTKDEIDAWSVRIVNLTGTGVGSSFVHHAARLFRRERCHWTGRLHEQICLREGNAPISQALLDDGGWIRHTGYMDDRFAAKGKAERNLRVAQAEVDRVDEAVDRGYSLTSLARSLVLVGRPGDALAKVDEALASTDNTITRRLAVRTAIDALLLLGRPDDALLWCGRFRQEGGEPNSADALEGGAHLAAGRPAEALALLDRVEPDRTDADGMGTSAAKLAGIRAEALAALGRHAEAAQALLDCLSDEGVSDAHLGLIADNLRRAGRADSDIAAVVAAALPPERSTFFLAQILQLEPPIADLMLEAAVTGSRLEATAVLAAASRLAPRLALERALAWSARLRRAGQGESCPLIAIATGNFPPVFKARAAAIAHAAFADPRAESAFVSAARPASGAERRAICAEAAAICPPLAPLLPARPPASPLPSSRSTLSASVVIPLFNRADLTLQCLQSLAANTAPGSYEVILVDNGSTDQTASLQESESSGFRLIRNETNLGFARACNQGAAAARSDVIVFLNNDVVPLAGWLPALLEALTCDPEVGIAGARLLYPDGILQHAGVDLAVSPDGYLRGDHRYYRCAGDHPPAMVRADVHAVTGAAMAVSRSLFEAVGGFHEGYWNGNEDLDLCLTVADRGMRIVYEPSSTLVHFESQSGAERWTGYDRNVALLQQRWGEKYARRAAPRQAVAVGAGTS